MQVSVWFGQPNRIGIKMFKEGAECNTPHSHSLTQTRFVHFEHVWRRFKKWTDLRKESNAGNIEGQGFNFTM